MSTKSTSTRESVLRVLFQLGLVAWTGWALLANGAAAAEPRDLSKPQRGPGAAFQSLSGGNARELWRGYKHDFWPKGWAVEAGVISRTASSGDLITKEQYSDFELRLQWKISPGGNSGIMYRVSTGEDAAYWTGPEYQVLDDTKHKDGKISSTAAGSLYALYARTGGAPRPAGEWNDARIVVVGNHLKHWLNGKKVVDCEIGSDDWNKRVEESKFADWPKFAKNRRGHIALQDHGDQVWYRKIEIRRIDR